MNTIESKKVAAVLENARALIAKDVGPQRYLIMSLPKKNSKYSKCDIRHWTFQDGEFFPYGELSHEEELEKAIAIGSTKKKGQVFFANIKRLRVYIVADSEEEACEVAAHA